MNKQDLISKIKQLDGISQDERAYLINLVNTKKKYGLVWEDKPEAVEEQLRENLPVLKEVKEKAIINGEDNPNHILIEGDNLHALTALTFTHEGKIDVIYIDPPYNTGNKDFRYNDTFKDEFIDKENPFRHSTWLSFMSRRLKIAKRLLSDKGVIFISIDDNEVAQLKLLCDEILTEKNLIGFFTWVRKKKGSNLSKEFRKITENLLCYKKNEVVELYGVKAYAEKQVPLLNRPNNISTLTFPKNTIKVGKGVKDGLITRGIFGDGELSVELLNDINVLNSVILNDFQLVGRFRWSQKTVDEELLNGSEFYISNSFRINVSRYNQNEKFKSPSSLITPEDGIGTNEDASEELRNIFCEYDKLPFDYPKPVTLISYIINSCTVKNKTATILDFFAGSGTTLHATMALNAEDGGNRQCILVTNNENNICEEVTYERNKRVIQGYTNTKGVAVEGLKNNNLRYYKSEFVPSNKSESNKRLLTEISTDLLCIKEDCYSPFNHQTFTDKECKIFTNGKGKFMVVVYHSRNLSSVCEQLISFIPTLAATEKVRLYVFSPEKETLLEEFQDIEEHVIAVPLPEAIYNAYRATFKILKLDKKPMMVTSPEDEPASEMDLFTNEEEA
jgi:adenine-specific DNA-methyltransferase